MLIPIEFTSAQRLVEKEKFEKLLIITTQTTFFILITMHIFQHTSRLENENVYKWYQLKLRTDPDWTYDRAVIILTHVEIDILGHELNVTLAIVSKYHVDTIGQNKDFMRQIPLQPSIKTNTREPSRPTRQRHTESFNWSTNIECMSRHTSI